MKYLIIDIWDFDEVKNEKIQRLKTEKFDKIILLSQHEYCYWDKMGSFSFTDFLELVRKQNKILHVVISSPNVYEEVPKFDNVELQSWDTFWIMKTYVALHHRDRLTHSYKINLDSPTYTKHFICMNNRPHYHRCLLIDLLAKYDLIKDNAISWHGKEVTHSFNYFKPQVLELDTSYSTTLEQYDLPKEYYETFAQLIGESTTTAIFLTEKTAMPLLTGKPFLVATCCGFHQFLKDIGFKLYDEIFDYSFDDEPDERKRFEMVVENFKRLSMIPMSELPKLTAKIKDKIIYNRNLAEKIAIDRSFYPPVAKEIIEAYEQRGEELDHWIVGMIQQLNDLSITKLLDNQ